MRDGLIKVAAGTPEIRVADVWLNRDSILALINEAAGRGAKILCLPELCLTGATCGDLFFQDVLIESAERALEDILGRTKGFDMLFALGLPVRRKGRLYNCAAVCGGGRLLGLVPKAHINAPNESRWFAHGEGVRGEISFAGAERIRFDYNAVFDTCGLRTGVIIGGLNLCAYNTGVSLLLGLSSDNEVIGAADIRREASKKLSGDVGAIVRAGAGAGESTTDFVFAGHNIIASNGLICAESRFKTGLVFSDLDIIDLQKEEILGRAVSMALPGKKDILPLPFVPENQADCEDALKIAALGLSSRMRHTGAKGLVLGVSGGLDSTLAMLICARALDELSLPRKNLIAVTMPGFGTTGRTKNNAIALSEMLGAELREISIEKAVRQHFADIGHDENNPSVVFENAQARERTQILMDIANGIGGLVVGTGGMSELALGWATYNGDHMSMYGVNAGIPKTLARVLVTYVADTDDKLSGVLRDVLETPVSPELLPSSGGVQATEEKIGPYELHDFFLFYFVLRRKSPKEILLMAEAAFDGKYDWVEIIKWERVFMKRFFSQQFKRSCMPDSPQIVDFSLSPRGGHIMPSDASCELWLRELDDLC